MRIRTRLLAASIFLLVGICTYFAFSAGEGPTSADYPGKFPGEGVKAVNYADVLVQHGAMAYYRINGHWPDSWADVVDSGLVTTQLYGPHMQALDPDDGRLDYGWDVVYENTNGEAQVFVKSTKGVKIQTQTLLAPVRYAELFESPVFEQSDISAWKSKSQQTVFAVLSILDAQVQLFKEIHGRYPAGLSELSAARLSPIAPQTINPLTGQPYKGDGSPNDFIYEATAGGYTLRHTNSAGETEPMSFTY